MSASSGPRPLDRREAPCWTASCSVPPSRPCSPGRASVRCALHQDLASVLRPLHVGMHLSPVLLARSGSMPGSGVERTPGRVGASGSDLCLHAQPSYARIGGSACSTDVYRGQSRVHVLPLPAATDEHRTEPDTSSTGYSARSSARPLAGGLGLNKRSIPRWIASTR